MRGQQPLGDARASIAEVKCFLHEDRPALSSEVCFPKLSHKWYKTAHSELRNSCARYYRLRRCPIAVQHNQV